MPIILKRNATTGELESHWVNEIVPVRPISNEAAAKGVFLRRYSADRQVTMGEIADQIGCSILDVSAVFMGEVEIDATVEQAYLDAVDGIVSERGRSESGSHL